MNVYPSALIISCQRQNEISISLGLSSFTETDKLLHQSLIRRLAIYPPVPFYPEGCIGGLKPQLP